MPASTGRARWRCSTPWPGPYGNAAAAEVRIAVIGVGLIGGSVALAARERLGAAVAGFDADPRALEEAVARGVLDAPAASIGEAAHGCEAVFVAVPVGSLPGAVAAALAGAPADCVVTGVGSTKRAVVAAADDERFVGGHPLAGAESAGVRYARADLFEGATWYLTPTERTSGILYERLHRMLHRFGARPAAIDPQTHDMILATVSHLPHVLANVLVTQAARTLAAGDREAIAAWNDRAAADRRRLLEAQLAGGPLSELRVSVPNRPGVIAQLALELGRAGVNIADLALHPAPDMSEGVVALWTTGEGDSERAQALIEALGFPVTRP